MDTESVHASVVWRKVMLVYHRRKIKWIMSCSCKRWNTSNNYRSSNHNSSIALVGLVFKKVAADELRFHSRSCDIMSHQSINESDARGHGLNKPRLESSEPTNILSQPNYISNITIDRQLVVYSHGCCKANEV